MVRQLEYIMYMLRLIKKNSLQYVVTLIQKRPLVDDNTNSETLGSMR